ncbi:hypothetical protein GZH47_32595 (plasmid) [Paenibacillus rhizovicinus]|uniref:Fibronectin type III domain-containing protein n=1 Tax=Paenibacillus rhizovicinus TaxID=2704463 RepID=A0A6C0PAX3_9BACL|nr:hypothetical protein [Paenibacillus rhizovicinus]QHW35639.1 hypothetical protein GZH47_32595 [Paenibacillus rhizovicinus]
MAFLESLRSAAVLATAGDTLSPAKVLNLIYSVAQGKVTLNWDPVTLNSDETAIDDLAGYRIYRKDSAGDSFASIGTVAATTSSQVTTYDDTTALDGASYIYAVSAIDDELTPNEGETSDDLAVKTIPSIPVNLVATSGDGIIRLTWDAVTDGAAPKKNENLAGYRLYRKVATDAGEHQFLLQLGAGVTLHDDSTVENGVQYSYVVSAIDDSL